MASPFSNADKFRLAFRFCQAPFYVSAYVARATVLAGLRGLPLRDYVLCGVYKALQDVFDARETQYLCPPTKEVYKSWVEVEISKLSPGADSEKAGRLSCDIEPLEDGNSSILWLGDRNKAKKVVLFFHGGGFTTPMLTSYMEWLWRSFIVAGIEAETEVAVAILEYTLCPVARYPMQLRHAASGLSHLLASGIPPENIIIGGDSAGGNLTGQLMCHLVWPHPEAVQSNLAKPFAGVFLISPWLTKETNDRSFVENGSIDMLSADFVKSIIGVVVGYNDWETRSTEECSHLFALDMEKPWMHRLSALTNQMYVSVGYHEVFRDQCIDFVGQVQKSNPEMELQFDLQETMAHDFILIEGDDKRNGECIEALKKWTKSVLIANS
ncbi:Alpha/Beta hydrolase protein [Ilyonectria sp. MPI-CAGE-AT-0026]|nr:Alpha/Beta hydrolase protein [Ilyonectria sp. MPI-CAGE-AT-0026]